MVEILFKMFFFKSIEIIFFYLKKIDINTSKQFENNKKLI